MSRITCIWSNDYSSNSRWHLGERADALLANGARKSTPNITHGLLSGGAAARITSSRLKELVHQPNLDPAGRGSGFFFFFPPQQGAQHRTGCRSVPGSAEAIGPARVFSKRSVVEGSVRLGISGQGGFHP